MHALDAITKNLILDLHFRSKTTPTMEGTPVSNHMISEKSYSRCNSYEAIATDDMSIPDSCSDVKPGAVGPGISGHSLKYKLHRSMEKGYTISPINRNEKARCNSSFSKLIDSSSELEIPVNKDAEEQEEATAKKRKKRKLNPENWGVNRAKVGRNCGLQYVSASKNKKEYPERRMRPPCGAKCKQMCTTKIDENQRLQIFNSYWALGDLHKQRCFIADCMVTIRPKYRYSSTENQRHLNHAFYFDINERIRVCKTFFKATLDICDRPIRTVIAKKKDTGIVEPDFRGRNSHSTVPPEVKNKVQEEDTACKSGLAITFPSEFAHNINDSAISERQSSIIENTENDDVMSWFMNVTLDGLSQALKVQKADQQLQDTTSRSTCEGGSAMDDTIPTAEVLNQRLCEIVNLQNNLRALELLLTSHRHNLLTYENAKNEKTQPIKKLILQDELMCTFARVEHDAKDGGMKASFLLEQFENHGRWRSTWSDGMMRLFSKWRCRDCNAYKYVRRAKILCLPGPGNARMQ